MNKAELTSCIEFINLTCYLLNDVNYEEISAFLNSDWTCKHIFFVRIDLKT